MPNTWEPHLKWPVFGASRSWLAVEGSSGRSLLLLIPLPPLLQAVTSTDAFRDRTGRVELLGFSPHRRAVPLSARLEAVS